MPLKECLTCHNLYPAANGDKGRCPTHRTTTARGLGWQHQQIRTELLSTQGTCCLCGRELTDTDPPELHHLVPRSHGGPTTPDNTALAHRSCNLAQSDQID